MNYTDQVTALNKTQLESVLKLAELASDNFDKLADLQLKAVKNAYAEGLKSLRQLTSVKDVNELASVSSLAAQPAWDKAAAYARGVYETVASAQAQFAGVMEQQLAEVNKAVALTVDSALKSAPAGSEAAIAALKSTLQSTNAVYESVVKAAKQMSAVAEANVATFAAEAPASKKRAG
jgi:phasin family protein